MLNLKFHQRNLTLEKVFSLKTRTASGNVNVFISIIKFGVEKQLFLVITKTNESLKR